jgi:eukaryotic-like serine/threonine-protein kinase
VAVKMVLSGVVAGETALQRLRAEAEIAAALQHPNIVRIHEVGEHEGQPFFSMDLVEGRSLAEIARHAPLPARRAARYVRIIAEALHYAHTRGVLHRDLKPSNILIDESDQPRVTDFGLAKQLDATHELTLTGQVFGSPSFLSPEQATGTRHITSASDVHALGALLYHLLTARPPFLAESIPATLRLVSEAEPIPPRLLAPDVPRDLETICLKCLEKDPRQRYGTAQQLAEDLERFLNGEPPRARAVGLGGRTFRWAKRRPALATLVGTVAFLLVVIAVGSLISAARLKRANAEGLEKLREAYLSQARAHRWSGKPGRRFESLDVLHRAALIRPGMDLRNEAIAALALVDIRTAKSWRVPPGTLFHLSASHDSFVRATPGGGVSLFRADEAAEVARIPRVSALLRSVSLSPQSGFCVLDYGTNSPGLELLRWKNTRTLLTFTNLQVRSYAFTSDERLLAVAGTSLAGKPKYWVETFALATGAPHSRFAAHTLPSVEFNVPGDQIAVFGVHSAEVQIHDTSSGQRLHTLPHGHRVSGVSWFREGQGLLAACDDGQVYVWNLASTNKNPAKLRHGSVVSAVHVSPDDRFVTSTGWDDQLRVWDLNSGFETLRMPALGFRSFGFAGTGHFIARWSTPERVEASEIADAREVRLLDAGEDSQCGFSPDGKLLLSSDASGLRVREVPSGRVVGRLEHDECKSAEVVWREDSVFTANKVGLRRWTVGYLNGGNSNVLELVGGPLMSDGKELGGLQVDSAGRRVAVARDGWLEVRDARTGRLIFPRSRQQHIASAFTKAAISPDGEWVAGRLWEGGAYIWQVTGRDNGRLLHSNATCVAFSPDGRWCVTGSPSEYLFWDSSTWEVARQIPRPPNAGVHGMAVFDPRVTTVALRFTDRSFGLFDPKDGSQLATVEAPVDARLGTGRFNANGFLVVPCLDRDFLVAWDWRSIRHELGKMNLDWDAPNWPAPAAGPKVTGLRWRIAEGVFGARDPRCTKRQIDLSAHYNATFEGFSRFTGDPENELSALPRGLQRLAGTDFDVRGVIELVEYARTTNSIPVAQLCRSLHFLHSALFAVSTGAKPDTLLGEYIVRYADGVTHSIPLRNLKEIADWWERDTARRKLGDDLVRAWQGTSRMSQSKANEILLYKFSWHNPRPDVAIASIQFRRTPQGARPFLVGLTTE